MLITHIELKIHSKKTRHRAAIFPWLQLHCSCAAEKDIHSGYGVRRKELLQIRTNAAAVKEERGERRREEIEERRREEREEGRSKE